MPCNHKLKANRTKLARYEDELQDVSMFLKPSFRVFHQKLSEQIFAGDDRHNSPIYSKGQLNMDVNSAIINNLVPK